MTSSTNTTDLIAILFLHDSAFHTFGAAVAAIVGTPFIVVAIIAIAVSLVLRRPTRTRGAADTRKLDAEAHQTDEILVASEPKSLHFF